MSQNPHAYPMPDDEAEPPAERELTVAEYVAAVKGAIIIPANTAPTPCKKCHELIYFTPHPVSVERYKNSPRGIEPTMTTEGAGVSHFSNCHFAEHFRRRAP